MDSSSDPWIFHQIRRLYDYIHRVNRSSSPVGKDTIIRNKKHTIQTNSLVLPFEDDFTD